ncbi:hypothetical protein SUGI_0364410 [Cryptomeria japonica]|nr:hypothetical protein SUGI_0364410 [Cryptomeria japonica]
MLDLKQFRRRTGSFRKVKEKFPFRKACKFRVKGLPNSLLEQEMEAFCHFLGLLAAKRILQAWIASHGEGSMR